MVPVVVLVVAVTGLLQLLGWSKFQQPSGSMAPSLLVGDYFFVDRQAYADKRRPDYGDIILFYVPGQAKRIMSP